MRTCSLFWISHLGFFCHWNSILYKYWIFFLLTDLQIRRPFVKFFCCVSLVRNSKLLVFGIWHLNIKVCINENMLVMSDRLRRISSNILYYYSTKPCFFILDQEIHKNSEKSRTISNIRLLAQKLIYKFFYTDSIQQLSLELLTKGKTIHL